MSNSPSGAAQPARVGNVRSVRVREEVIFTDDKGQEAKSVRKRAERLIERLEEPLARLLEPQEAVLYVVSAQAPISAFEQLGLGWYLYRVTKSVLIFTDRRILHILVNADDTWRRMVRRVWYGDIAEARTKGWLSRLFILRYRDGSQERYWRVQRRDAKKIARLVAESMSAGSQYTSQRGAMVSLCPTCKAELLPRVYTCPNCAMRFKDERTMVRRSLLIPGGGYFYTGNWLLGVGDFITETVLLLVVIAVALEVFGVIAPDPGQERANAIVLGILVAVLAFEKWLTIHHCRKFIRSFIPAD